MSAPRLNTADAAACLARGGIIAYPTEGVWGLGCDPEDEVAVLRLLRVKQRPVEKGLILIAGSAAQLEAIVDWQALDAGRRDALLTSWPGPNTWVVPALPAVPRWITGTHDSVAVRVSAHAPVVALCEAFGRALVSTSANPAGAPSPHSIAELDAGILASIDGVLDGETGGRGQPSTIRDARSGQILRG